MAIVINHNPVQYASANGALLFTVYEATKANDATTYPNYKYVADVYIGGTLITRLKAFPHPVHKRGVFDIGPIVRGYLSASLNLTTGLLAQQLGSGAFYIDVQVKFGEEYGFALYPNVLIDDERRYYNSYETQPFTAIPALYTRAPGWATNRPTKTTVRQTDTDYFVPYFSLSGSLAVSVTAYNLSGSTTNSATLTVTAGKLQLLNLSPFALNVTISGAVPAGTVYYTVTIGGITYTFTIVSECKHTPYVLHFLNQYGGFESFTFYKLSRNSYEGERKTYSQLPYRMDGNGAILYSSNGVAFDTKTSYASQYRRKTKISTDLLTDAEWAWLKELVFSPLVYTRQSGYFYPVTILNTNYEEKKFINDKQQSLQVDLDFGHTINTQYR